MLIKKFCGGWSKMGVVNQSGPETIKLTASQE